MVYMDLVVAAAASLVTWLIMRVKYRKYFMKVAELARDSQAVTEDLLQERRKNDEIAAKISGIISERDEWRRLYQAQSSQHASAQAYLLRTLEQVVREFYKKTGEAVPLDGTARELVVHFATEHSEAIEAYRESHPVAKGSSAPLQTVKSESSPTQ